MFELFPIFGKILGILDKILEVLLKFSLLIAVFFIIYLGMKIYFEKKNLRDIRISFLFIILGLTILGIIILNGEIIFKTIEIFVPKFK
ncbi:MAG: hypothetical protein ACO2O4_02170 [Minisyncoccia bacterium]|jgi:hypothetical protein